MVNRPVKYIGIIALIVALDSFLKIFFLENYPSLITINTGIGLGLMKDQYYAILAASTMITLVFLFLLVNELKSDKRSYALAFSYSLIIGGSISNLIDRIIYKHVIDYLYLPVIPVFNIADFSVTIGMTILIILLLKKE